MVNERALTVAISFRALVFCDSSVITTSSCCTTDSSISIVSTTSFPDVTMIGIVDSLYPVILNVSMCPTETVEQIDVDAEGKQSPARSIIFSYLVSIIETRPGNLSVEEDRRALSRTGERS